MKKIAIILATLSLSLAGTANAAPPPGATAQCRDHTYSYAKHHRGACSHHGGVAKWLKVVPK